MKYIYHWGAMPPYKNSSNGLFNFGHFVKNQNFSQKKKFGSVNCADLGKMVIPDCLTLKHGSLTLIYDSRNERGDADVVLIFSHPRVYFTYRLAIF